MTFHEIILLTQVTHVEIVDIRGQGLRIKTEDIFRNKAKIWNIRMMSPSSVRGMFKFVTFWLLVNWKDIT